MISAIFITIDVEICGTDWQYASLDNFGIGIKCVKDYRLFITR